MVYSEYPDLLSLVQSSLQSCSIGYLKAVKLEQSKVFSLW